MFDSQKTLRKEKKNAKENHFLIFDCLIKKIKENQVQIKLLKNLSILKLFNLYIVEFK